MNAITPRRDLDILSDDELDDLMLTNPKAAMVYMKMLNALVRQTEAAAPVATAPAPLATQSPPSSQPAALATAATPFPDLSVITRVEVTIWDNADEHGRRPKHQTRYKAEIKGWTIDCEGVKAPRHQWARNVSVYDRWPFTAKFEKLDLSDEYLRVLNHLVGHGSDPTRYAMLGDKSGGTNWYDRQVLMFDLTGASITRGLLWIGEDALELPPFVHHQAGQDRKPLHPKIVAQSRWSRDAGNWSTAVDEEVPPD